MIEKLLLYFSRPFAHLHKMPGFACPIVSLSFYYVKWHVLLLMCNVFYGLQLFRNPFRNLREIEIARFRQYFRYICEITYNP